MRILTCVHSKKIAGEGLGGGVVRASGAGVINGGLLAAAPAEEDASCLDKASSTLISLAVFAFASAVPTAVDERVSANEEATAFDDLVDANEEVVCIPDPVPLDGEEGASVKLSNVGKARWKGKVA